MNQSSRGLLGFASALAIIACALLPLPTQGQTASKSDQWIHVRVESKEDNGETVRVNVPVEMAEKVLPAINHDSLQGGKVHIDGAHLDNIDLHAVLDAVRTGKDGEYVTVQSNEDNVRIAKSAGYLYIHVTEKKADEKASKGADAKDRSVKHNANRDSKVEIKIPMKVVDALFSSGKDELDVVAALHALSATGDTELINVKDDDNIVRIWIDSKNIAD
jgi:hypothetical protein